MRKHAEPASLRRRLRRFVTAGFLLVFLLTPVARDSASAEDAPAAERVITHGPIAGGVSDTSAVIFLRTSVTSTVRLVYYPGSFVGGNFQITPKVRAVAENDFTVQIPLAGLQPATTYRYRVFLNRKMQALPVTPRFTTAPPSDTFANFSFAVFSDLSIGPQADALAYQSAAADSPAFVLQIGDFDHRNPGGSWWPATTIENWRGMHRDVLGDRPAGRDFATHIAPFFPFYHMWDDHDYGEDNADRTAPWKDLATQAFKEYFPLPPLPNPDSGLWYSFRYAQAEVFVLDLRSQRDPNDDPPGADKSVLDGASIPNGQKAWLKAGLLASTARWKFIVSTSAWNPNSKQVDSWHLYQDEQQELVQFIQNNNITGVIILSGDLHSGGGIDDGTNSFFPEISVPTTNIHRQRNCTGGYCGTWSEGIITGIDPSGYALITVQHDGATGADSVILQARDEDGSLRLEYTVELP